MRFATVNMQRLFYQKCVQSYKVWNDKRTTYIVVHSAHFCSGTLDVPVFPTIGNHESFPVNMFPSMAETGKYNPSWLYAGIATFYSHWITGREQRHTMANGGYYQALARPGLRIVSVNTNFCNSLNFFLLLNFDDPSSHLHWIYSVLWRAEAAGEKVFIIGHIPPGSTDCYSKHPGASPNPPAATYSSNFFSVRSVVPRVQPSRPPLPRHHCRSVLRAHALRRV